MERHKKTQYRVMLDKDTNELYAYAYLKGENTRVAENHIELGYVYGDHDGVIKYATEIFLNKN